MTRSENASTDVWPGRPLRGSRRRHKRTGGLLLLFLLDSWLDLDAGVLGVLAFIPTFY